MGALSSIDGVDPAVFDLGSDEEPWLRLGVGLDLYFGRPMDAHREGLLGLWEALLAWRGRDRFTWARLGGGNRSRKMSAAAYGTVTGWLRGTRSYDPHLFIDMHDGERFETIGHEAFRVDGNNRPIEDEDDCDINFVQLRFGLETLKSPDELVVALASVAAPLDYTCGTAGLMLHATPFGKSDLWGAMRERITRYHGVEPDMAEKVAWMARDGLGSVSWLTFIGAPHLPTLDGASSLIEQAESLPDVSARRVGRGVAVRAGERPRVGDREAPDDGLEPYRSVFHLLRPALYLEGDFGFSDDAFDAAATLAWQKRLGR